MFLRDILYVNHRVQMLIYDTVLYEIAGVENDQFVHDEKTNDDNMLVITLAIQYTLRVYLS